jgi:hypothetical protein
MSQKKREIKKEYTIVGQKAEENQTLTANQPQPMHIQISFDQWWLQTQQKYNFKTDLKEALKKHFEAKGFMDDSRNFDKGLKDFGFNT